MLGAQPRPRKAWTSARSSGTRPSASPPRADVDALLALDADCVVYSPIFADVDVVTRILESGKNLVTPLGWFYPPSRRAGRLDAVCRGAGVPCTARASTPAASPNVSR